MASVETEQPLLENYETHAVHWIERLEGPVELCDWNQRCCFACVARSLIPVFESETVEYAPVDQVSAQALVRSQPSAQASFSPYTRNELHCVCTSHMLVVLDHI